MAHVGRSGSLFSESDKKGEDKLSRAAKDASKMAVEAVHGIMAQIIKDNLFNKASHSCNH